MAKELKVSTGLLLMAMGYASFLIGLALMRDAGTTLDTAFEFVLIIFTWLSVFVVIAGASIIAHAAAYRTIAMRVEETNG